MSLPQSFEGKFETLHKISEGGMGAVYKVRHVLLDEVRVIKVVRPQHADDENLKARFHREARTATRLRHPNIAVMHDFSIDESGTAYIVMEFIDGQTLHQRLASSGPPPLAEALEIARQSLDALSYLHGEGYVHRDISPDNLMLTRGPGGEPLVKLIDLGVAKRVGGDHELTSTGMFLGKVRYSSPEQFSGVELDPRSDVYSFGVMLYELLTGRLPIQGEDFSSFIGGHLYRSPIAFDASDPEGRVPDGLRRVVMKTLEKKAENRVASADELSAMLAPYGRDALRHATQAVDQAEPTVLLSESGPSSLPTGVVTGAMEEIDRLLDAGRLAEAEQQLTQTIGEVGEVEHLRGLREKLERARAGHGPSAAPPDVPVAATRPLAEVGKAPEISAPVVTRTPTTGSDRQPKRFVKSVLLAMAAALAVTVGIWWVSTRQPITVAVPFAEQTYLQARDRFEAGDFQTTSRLLREVIGADTAEQAEREWATPGAHGSYLPHYLLGQTYAAQINCVLAIDAWNESERQGEVQKTPEHVQLLAEKGKCNEIHAEAVAGLEKRLEEAADYAALLDAATTDREFADLWRTSPELLRQIEDSLASYQALRGQLDQARDAGFGAALRLEPDVADVVEKLNDLADRVIELTS